MLKRARGEFKRDNLTDLAASLTYYGLLSIAPALVVLVAALGLLGRDATAQVVNQVQAIAPGSSAEFVRTLIAQAQANRTGAGLGAVFGLLVALWSASGYVSAFMRASNVIYDIPEGRPIWKTVPIRIGVTVLAVVVMIVSAVIVVVSGPVAGAGRRAHRRGRHGRPRLGSAQVARPPRPRVGALRRPLLGQPQREAGRRQVGEPRRRHRRR